MIFSLFEPGRPETSRSRFRSIPVRTLVPNAITVFALCAGLTAIRFATEQKFDWALYAVMFAALLDGIDGRLARMLKGASRFGAELDSLADFVNFGVAPALILYQWGLNEFRSLGWVAALVFPVCTALRLARFNVMAEDPARPDWAVNFFLGIPAPAGAITVLLPLYAQFLGLPHFYLVLPTFLYTLCIALLMVSRLPVFSGKRVGTRVPPKMVPSALVAALLSFGLLIAYPWKVLTVGSLAYLACLPAGWLSHREYARKAAGLNKVVPQSEEDAPALAPPPLSSGEDSGRLAQSN